MRRASGTEPSYDRCPSSRYGKVPSSSVRHAFASHRNASNDTTSTAGPRADPLQEVEHLALAGTACRQRDVAVDEAAEQRAAACLAFEAVGVVEAVARRRRHDHHAPAQCADPPDGGGQRRQRGVRIGCLLARPAVDHVQHAPCRVEVFVERAGQHHRADLRMRREVGDHRIVEAQAALGELARVRAVDPGQSQQRAAGAFGGLQYAARAGWQPARAPGAWRRSRPRPWLSGAPRCCSAWCIPGAGIRHRPRRSRRCRGAARRSRRLARAPRGCRSVRRA